MHTTEIVVPPRFRAGGPARAAAVRAGERTAPEGSTAWTRFVLLMQHGRSSDADRSPDAAGAAPRRDLPVPFC